MTAEEKAATTELVQQQIEQGVLEVQQKPDSRFLCNIFPKHEADKIRPLLDARPLNQYLATEKFKMDILPSVNRDGNT